MTTVEDKQRRRGRPPSAERRKVFEALITAAEDCIDESSTADVSAMQIAEKAGVSERMINYYFGSKDHLIFLIMKRAAREMCIELRKLEAKLFEKPCGNPTWHIINTCATFEENHSVYSKIFPKIEGEFYSLLQPSVHDQLAKILQGLINAGVYSSQLDVRYAIFTIAHLMTAPDRSAFALPLHDLGPDVLHSKEWLTFISSMLDQQFRNPQRLTEELELENSGG